MVIKHAQVESGPLYLLAEQAGIQLPRRHPDAQKMYSLCWGCHTYEEDLALLNQRPCQRAGDLNSLIDEFRFMKKKMEQPRASTADS